ncbi:MAG: hypothetical protein EOS58_01180 [Mesorhizobium sp.]|uniref:hypothetical protein n=1 Tax=unclassified Mesorhizobium TaxID=325217 RepID=UPI000F7608E8|nr:MULTISPECIES: hypothetical protein [unclassified Mesorhizobium]RVD70286.1 hypothetical protein EN751_21485 [Mesorhizobium sp. M4A.F.Ca.ET.029.04.2.1]AZO51497.1 hypothetical protein EJ073_29985 [Mesorhizobium sp. M4B.F.Ca.ET.058.02.1.1]RUX47583.1 hypothetical protein EOA33_18010 [Mesorhizobium sp. M4A.F.Ca.ET.050.02.1.1]RVC40450.1 hypothetical protein EN781_29590 [Mesorhizobium sp. M4A.F.Ca.ET.090.04.2.1]RVC78953.1 hypothetical protein EN745_17390 [Mesorhizobium sp. M4A.F.Ca.ET.022.05.2.1]
MFNTIKTAALSALVGLGTLAAIPAAHADSLYLGFGNNQDPRFGVYTGDDDGYYHRRHRSDDNDWRDDRGWRRGCSPERALDKAERMGLHRVRIVDVGRRTVKVMGRQYGDRVVVVFANVRGCPIIYR